MSAHPSIEPLAFVVGTWKGRGAGSYPTIEAFEYRETVSIKAPPHKPFLVYTQQTWRDGDHPDAGEPLHIETGYFRPIGPDKVEMVLAQPTGIVEVHGGRIEGTSISLRTDTVATTPTAKEVVTVERNLRISGDDLDYEVLIGAVGQSHQLHLRAKLRRVS